MDGPMDNQVRGDSSKNDSGLRLHLLNLRTIYT